MLSKRWIILAAAPMLFACTTFEDVATDADAPVTRKPPIEGVIRASGKDAQTQRIFTPAECGGPIDNGVCKGPIRPQARPHAICKGEVINGLCTSY